MTNGDIDTLFVFSPTFLEIGAVDQIDLAAANLAESLGFDDFSYAPELRRFVVANLFADDVRQDRATRLTVPFVLSTHEVGTRWYSFLGVPTLAISAAHCSTSQVG